MLSKNVSESVLLNLYYEKGISGKFGWILSLHKIQWFYLIAVDLQSKTFLVLYPFLENSTTGIAIPDISTITRLHHKHSTKSIKANICQISQFHWNFLKLMLLLVMMIWKVKPPMFLFFLFLFYLLSRLKNVYQGYFLQYN